MGLETDTGLVTCNTDVMHINDGCNGLLLSTYTHEELDAEYLSMYLPSIFDI